MRDSVCQGFNAYSKCASDFWYCTIIQLDFVSSQYNWKGYTVANHKAGVSGSKVHFMIEAAGLKIIPVPAIIFNQRQQ